MIKQIEEELIDTQWVKTSFGINSQRERQVYFIPPFTSDILFDASVESNTMESSRVFFIGYYIEQNEIYFNQ